jgi:hypothetical protein
MTAARYKAPSNFLALAGSRLGLDLLELFKEDEEGQQGFEGLAPTFKTTATTKGRGGVLGYKAPKMPTTVSEFSLMPEPRAMSVTTPASAPAPTPMPTATKKSYDFFSKPNLGGPGFGAKDIEAARSEGYSTDEIKNFLVQNQQFFGPGRLNLAEDIQKELNLPYSFVNPQVQADVLAGKYGATPGLNLVPQAAPAPSPTPKFENPLQTQEFVNAPSTPAARTGISTGYGISGEYFGGEDLEAAREAGYSDREIKEFLDKNISGLLREGNLPGRGGVYDQLRI